MKSLVNYIDEFKKRLHIPSDYQLAAELGVKRQQVSRIRNNQVAIGRGKCLRIAEVLRIEPMEIIATIEANKEKNPELKAMWIKLAKEKGNM